MTRTEVDQWGGNLGEVAHDPRAGGTNEIQVTQETYEMLRGDYELEERGEIEVKGKGRLRTWWLRGTR